MWTDVEDAAGKTVPALTYKVPRAVPERRPGRYLDVALPAELIEMLDRAEVRD